MGSLVPSDPLLAAAFYVGFVVSLIVVVLVSATLELRSVTDARRRAEAALSERWHPAFLHAMEGLPYAIPRFRRGDWETVLLVWLTYTESIRGAARERLRTLARNIHLDHVALRLVGRRNVRARTLGAVAAGRMRAAGAAQTLLLLSGDENRALALLALRGLLETDPAAGLPVFFARLQHGEDWPPVRVAAMLEDVPTEKLAPLLRAALANASSAALPRLIGLLDIARIEERWPLLAPYLKTGQADEVVIAALKACNDPRALPALRRLTYDERWAVRAQAVAAMGRIGNARDRSRLQALMADSEWWVRYRAASALTSLPGVSRQGLGDLQREAKDRFAGDILGQVLAEKNLGTK